jgi:hypothetical protein
LKRTLLLKKIADIGAVFLRHGSDHDIYQNPKSKDQGKTAYPTA